MPEMQRARQASKRSLGARHPPAPLRFASDTSFAIGIAVAQPGSITRLIEIWVYVDRSAIVALVFLGLCLVGILPFSPRRLTGSQANCVVLAFGAMILALVLSRLVVQGPAILNSPLFFAVLGLQLFGINGTVLALPGFARCWRASADHTPRSHWCTGPALALSVVYFGVVFAYLFYGFHIGTVPLLAILLAASIGAALFLEQSAGRPFAPTTPEPASPAPPTVSPPSSDEEAPRMTTSDERPEKSLAGDLNAIVPPSAAFSGPGASPSAPATSLTPADVRAIPRATRMQLKLRRAQRSSFAGKVLFTLDARMEIPAEERQLISKHRLGDLVIYDSAARERYINAAQTHFEQLQDRPGSNEGLDQQAKGLGKAFYRLARAGVSAAIAALTLRITIDSLQSGVHVECKSMDELLGAEKAIISAAENLRSYLETAATFDGREEVLEF